MKIRVQIPLTRRMKTTPLHPLVMLHPGVGIGDIRGAGKEVEMILRLISMNLRGNFIRPVSRLAPNNTEGFEYKQIPKDKKVKQVALKLKKYASIRRSNVVAKRARKRKSEIKS